jgi:hypothetical protein
MFIRSQRVDAILQPTLIAALRNICPADAAFCLLALVAAITLIGGNYKVLHVVAVVVHARAALAFL